MLRVDTFRGSIFRNFQETWIACKSQAKDLLPLAPTPPQHFNKINSDKRGISRKIRLRKTRKARGNIFSGQELHLKPLI